MATVNESLLLIGIKISGLKHVLTDKQLNEYNNFVIDFIEKHQKDLKQSLSPKVFAELKTLALK